MKTREKYEILFWRPTPKHPLPYAVTTTVLRSHEECRAVCNRSPSSPKSTASLSRGASKRSAMVSKVSTRTPTLLCVTPGSFSRKSTAVDAWSTASAVSPSSGSGRPNFAFSKMLAVIAGLRDHQIRSVGCSITKDASFSSTARVFSSGVAVAPNQPEFSRCNF